MITQSILLFHLSDAYVLPGGRQESLLLSFIYYGMKKGGIGLAMTPFNGEEYKNVTDVPPPPLIKAVQTPLGPPPFKPNATKAIKQDEVQDESPLEQQQQTQGQKPWLPLFKKF